MKNKKIIIAVSVLFVVAAIFIISGKMASVSPPEHRTKLFPALEERHVSALVIIDGESRIKLERSNGGWAVAAGDSRFKADSALAQIAVERVVSLKKTDLVSDNPDNQPKFEVGDDAKSSVEVYAADRQTPAGVLLIGKNGPEWNSNYVRLKGANEVYLMLGSLRQALFFDLERWREKETPAPEPEPESTPDPATETASTAESEPAAKDAGGPAAP